MKTQSLKDEVFEATYKAAKEYKEITTKIPDRVQTKALIVAVEYITLYNVITAAKCTADYEKWCNEHHHGESCTIDLDKEINLTVKR